MVSVGLGVSVYDLLAMLASKAVSSQHGLSPCLVSFRTIAAFVGVISPFAWSLSKSWRLICRNSIGHL